MASSASTRMKPGAQVLAARYTSSGVTPSSAGASAAVAGATLKYTLVTRASFNQGFALSKLPVRGVRSHP